MRSSAEVLADAAKDQPPRLAGPLYCHEQSYLALHLYFWTMPLPQGDHASALKTKSTGGYRRAQAQGFQRKCELLKRHGFPPAKGWRAEQPLIFAAAILLAREYERVSNVAGASCSIARARVPTTKQAGVDLLGAGGQLQLPLQRHLILETTPKESQPASRSQSLRAPATEPHQAGNACGCSCPRLKFLARTSTALSVCGLSFCLARTDNGESKAYIEAQRRVRRCEMASQIQALLQE